MQEYFEFLELQNNATQAEIIQRIDEKQKLFSQLMQNAPNDYLKSIHQKNISKLVEIEQTLTRGYVKPEQQTANEIFIESDGAIAWLIRHTENKNSKSFPLFSGTNFIGRSSNNKLNEIIIDDDIYISRNHATILIENDNYKITDLGSKNGTYINGQEQKIESLNLNNLDTIQIGNTKIVLKIASNKNVDALVKEVDSSEYMKTIVINIL